MIFRCVKNIFQLKNWVYILLGILGPVLIFSFSTIYLNQYKKELTQQNKKTFEQVVRLFEDRLRSYVFGLQGMSGVYRIKNFDPSPELITDYAISRNFFSNFEGSLGFGFIRAVDLKSLQNYIHHRELIDSRFKYKELSKVKDNTIFIIETIEPFDKNVAAFGLSISSEKERRAAALEAAKTGLPAISREVQLVQSSKKEPGYLIFLPIYISAETPIVKERLKSIVGFSYTPVLSSSIINYLRSEMSFDFKFAIKMQDSPSYFFNDLKNQPANFYKTVNLLGKTWELRAHFSISRTFYIILICTYIIALIVSILYLRVVCFIKNLISEKVSIREKYGDIENRLDTVMNNTSLSIIATDKNGVIDTINTAGLKMLGYESDELVGKLTPLVFHDIEEVKERGRIIQQELKPNSHIDDFEVFVLKTRSGKPNINDWIYVRKDGSRLPVRLIVTTLFNSQKEIVGYLGVAEDISERNKLQKVIEEQQAQMYESSKLSTLGEMASGIAHEINNPLTIISSKANQIIKKLDKGNLDIDALKCDLKKIDETAFRISKIVLGLRLLSRNSSQDDFEEVNLLEIIDEVLSLCTERFRFNNVKLMYELQGEVVILARASQVGQVILNLLNNSFDAVELLSEKWVKISLTLDVNFVIIKITDSGKGILPQVRGKIFEPFFTTKEVGRGTGLGLSISKNIITSHGGDFSYDRYSENTTFIITLPRVK